MKKYLTVNEFSRFSGIEQTTLRYWDGIGLFSPAKRNPDNNYRYYTPQQIVAVNFIKVLSELKIPLKTISELEKQRTPEKLVRLIEHHERLLDAEMRRLRECYSIMNTRRDLINFGIRLKDGFLAVEGKHIDGAQPDAEGTWVDENKVAVLEAGEGVFILGRRNIWRESTSFYEPFTEFCNSAYELRLNLSYPIGGYHDCMESFLRAPGQPDHFFSMDPSGNRKREAGMYLIGFSRGRHGEFGSLHEGMAAYAEENALALSGPVYTMYLHDEICMTEPGRYLTQVSVAVDNFTK